ncbi:MAG TPA: hypothetical protein VFD73_27660 [Gemmatimonadales bacterium]|nr:hypothetical protein [Gemmatimonadales bacterium]
MSAALIQASSRQPAASLARAYPAASCVLPAWHPGDHVHQRRLRSAAIELRQRLCPQPGTWRLPRDSAHDQRSASRVRYVSHLLLHVEVGLVPGDGGYRHLYTRPIWVKLAAAPG